MATVGHDDDNATVGHGDQTVGHDNDEGDHSQTVIQFMQQQKMQPDTPDGLFHRTIFQGAGTFKKIPKLGKSPISPTFASR